MAAAWRLAGWTSGRGAHKLSVSRVRSRVRLSTYRVMFCATRASLRICFGARHGFGSRFAVYASSVGKRSSSADDRRCLCLAKARLSSRSSRGWLGGWRSARLARRSAGPMAGDASSGHAGAWACRVSSQRIHVPRCREVVGDGMSRVPIGPARLRSRHDARSAFTPCGAI